MNLLSHLLHANFNLLLYNVVNIYYLVYGVYGN